MINRDFGSLIKQILQTDNLYIELLGDLLVEAGCNVKVELHVTRCGNTIVIRAQIDGFLEADP